MNSVSPAIGLVCKVCKFTSQNLDEVCYWDINRFPCSDELEIERSAQNQMH